MASVFNMDTQYCITNAEWERYSLKKLEPEVTQRIQHHVLACEICADIKDGIDTMKNPERLALRIENINSLTFEKQTPNLRIGFWYWSAAATITIGFGLGWLLNKQKKEIVADKETTKTINMADSTFANTSTIIPAKDSLAISAQATKGKKLTAYSTQEDLYKSKSATPDALIKDTTVASTENTNIDDESITFKKDTKTPITVEKILTETTKFENTKALNEEVNKINETVKTEDSKIEEGESVVLAVTGNKKSTDKEKTSKTKTQAGPSSAANKPQKEHVDAPRSSQEIIANEAKKYNVALMNFSSQQYDSCLQNLNAIITNKNSIYFEKGLMLKVKTLIAQQKIEEARTILRTIVQLKGESEIEAKNLLKQLKK